MQPSIEPRMSESRAQTPERLTFWSSTCCWQVDLSRLAFLLLQDHFDDGLSARQVAPPEGGRRAKEGRKSASAKLSEEEIIKFSTRVALQVGNRGPHAMLRYKAMGLLLVNNQSGSKMTFRCAFQSLHARLARPEHMSCVPDLPVVYASET
jgi:hypothetical protein